MNWPQVQTLHVEMCQNQDFYLQEEMTRSQKEIRKTA